MKKCVFCGNEYEKLSKEHIIPNALCGRIKSHNLICKKCNSEFGKDIDIALIKEYQFFIDLFNIKRERGESVPFVSTSIDDNKKYKRHKKYGYELAETYLEINKNQDNQFLIHIEGPVNKKKLLCDIGKYFSNNKVSLKEKGIDYRKAMNTVQKYIEDNWRNINPKSIPDRTNIFAFNHSFGGTDISLAILKILYLFLKNCKPDIKFDENKIKNILKNKSEKILDICFYYPFENLFDEIEDEISHHICIKASQNRIIGYIKLFSITPYVCILDDNYFGEPFECKYGFGLLSQKEFKPSCNCLNDFENLKDRLNYVNNEKSAIENAKKDLSRIMDLYYKKNPQARYTDVQYMFYKKLSSILGCNVLNIPILKKIIEKNLNFHFAENITIEDKEKTINHLVDCTLFWIINEVNCKKISKNSYTPDISGA